MDIVERLRDAAALPTGLYAEAATEVERLRSLLQNGSPVVEGTIQHMAMEIAALKKERDELRLGNLIKYGNTHPEMYKTELDLCREQLAAVKQECDALRRIAEEKMDEIAAAHAETDSVVYARDEAYRMLAECQKDADRYRWLRSHKPKDDEHGVTVEGEIDFIMIGTDYGATSIMEDELDAAIDAAMKESK